jgi:tRNA threonylcarbamoyladenosine biosynthesis protein TsaB
MILLGFDTATGATTAAVWDTGSDELWERRDDPPSGSRPRHTTMLLTLVEQALAAAGRGWQDVDTVAVGIGPGTFTGIRIGVATARALAWARGIPIVGVSTLEAVCARAAGPPEDPARILAVLDARRGEVFAAAWQRGQVGRGEAALVSPRAVDPGELAQTLARQGGSWRAVGDGAVRFRDVLQAGGDVEIPPDDSELHRVSAAQIVRLARGRTPAAVDEIEPEYLRLPDAELNRRARDTSSPS